LADAAAVPVIIIVLAFFMDDGLRSAASPCS
jgi:hypothetical protein